jgi:Ethanolamine utilization protein EutJ (predicted chaperonin)
MNRTGHVIDEPKACREAAQFNQAVAVDGGSTSGFHAASPRPAASEKV